MTISPTLIRRKATVLAVMELHIPEYREAMCYQLDLDPGVPSQDIFDHVRCHLRREFRIHLLTSDAHVDTGSSLVFDKFSNSESSLRAGRLNPSIISAHATLSDLRLNGASAQEVFSS